MHEARRRPARRNPRWMHAVERAARLQTANIGSKAVLLFTAFLPQFVDQARPLAPQFVPLGAAYMAVEFAAASAYAFAGSRNRVLRLGRRGARRINRVTGGMMIAAAGWLAGNREASRLTLSKRSYGATPGGAIERSRCRGKVSRR